MPQYATPSCSTPAGARLAMYHSLYIHVPFCSGGKCDYCAFYSIGDSTPELREKYLNRLEEEFTEHASECAPLRSIFVGGGTPSALATEELSQLLGAVLKGSS